MKTTHKSKFATVMSVIVLLIFSLQVILIGVFPLPWA